MIKLKNIINVILKEGRLIPVVIGIITPEGEIHSAKKLDSSHSIEGFHFGNKWRYNPETQTVYWSSLNWSDQDEDDMMNVENHLLKKYNFKVKTQIDLSKDLNIKNVGIAHGHMSEVTQKDIKMRYPAAGAFRKKEETLDHLTLDNLKAMKSKVASVIHFCKNQECDQNEIKKLYDDFKRYNDEIKRRLTYINKPVMESLNEPIPFLLYHATFKPLLSKIRDGGLKAGGTDVQNWKDIESGVYLGNDIDFVASFVEATENENIPDDWLDQIVILYIDTTNLDKSKFDKDPHMDLSGVETDPNVKSYIYRGDIPTSAIKHVKSYNESTNENVSLNERMTFSDLYDETDDDRIDRSKTMRIRSLDVKTENNNEMWRFSYTSAEKTEGKTHRGNIHFFKEDVTPEDNAEDLECMVDCSCRDFKFRWAYANAQDDASFIGGQSLNKCINRPPRRTNPTRHKQLCKHLAGLSKYLMTNINTARQRAHLRRKPMNIFESMNELANKGHFQATYQDEQ